MNTRPPKGFTLLEALTAAALAMLVLLALGYSYTNSRRLSNAQHSTLGSQNEWENLAQRISADVRRAGVFGCFHTQTRLGNGKPSTLLSGNSEVFIDTERSDGYGIRVGKAPQSGSDALIIVYGSGFQNVRIDKPNADTHSTFRSDTPLKHIGSPAVVSSCVRAHAFTPSSTPAKLLHAPAPLEFSPDEHSMLQAGNLHAVAYFSGTINSTSGIFRTPFENGKWQEPQLLSRNISRIDWRFAYAQNPCSEHKGTLRYTASPDQKALPVLLTLNLHDTHGGSQLLNIAPRAAACTPQTTD